MCTCLDLCDTKSGIIILYPYRTTQIPYEGSSGTYIPKHTTYGTVSIAETAAGSHQGLKSSLANQNLSQNHSFNPRGHTHLS